MTEVFIIFVLLLLLKLGTSIFLDCINISYVKAHSAEVPEGFREFIDLSTYQQSVEYTVAKTRFGLVNEVYDAVVLALIILTGFLPWLYSELSSFLGYSVWGLMLGLLACSFTSSARVSLPPPCYPCGSMLYICVSMVYVGKHGV